MTAGLSSFCDADAEVRRRRAAKIIALLQSRVDLAQARVLDVGTGSGHVAHCIAPACGSLASVDVWDQRVEKRGYEFALLDGDLIPFADGSFDVVISNQVYEHVADPQRHLAELHRVLKPGGFGHLATPNRFCLIEPHYRLPFLGWLPTNLANTYLKLLKGKTWDVRLVSWWTLRAEAGRYFLVEDRAPEVLQAPEKHHLDCPRWLAKILRATPKWMLHLLGPAMPSFLFGIRKRHA